MTHRQSALAPCASVLSAPTFAVIFIYLALGACSGGDAEKAGDGEAPAAAATIPHGAENKKAASVSAEAPRYSPVGRRDPFRSYLTDLAAQAAQQQPERKRELTEAFELGQYALTGLVTGTSQPKAMVEDPDGRGHILRIGSHLGKNGGLVSRIAQDGIVISEQTRDPTGKVVDLTIPVKLQPTDTKP